MKNPCPSSHQCCDICFRMKLSSTFKITPRGGDGIHEITKLCQPSFTLRLHSLIQDHGVRQARCCHRNSSSVWHPRCACVCVERFLAIPRDTYSTQSTLASISNHVKATWEWLIRMRLCMNEPILKNAQFLILDPSLTSGGCGILVSSHGDSKTAAVLSNDWWCAKTRTVAFVVWLVAY